jgi:hypothetical protein
MSAPVLPVLSIAAVRHGVSALRDTPIGPRAKPWHKILADRVKTLARITAEQVPNAF